MISCDRTDVVAEDFSVEDDSPEAIERERILEYIRSQRDRFRRTYHVRRMALIGSFARNEQSPDSDVDLIVDLEEGTPDIFELKRALRSELERQFHRKVEIASERYLKPYFRETILREAIYV
jgi:predicted nucleotidyltransferase